MKKLLFIVFTFTSISCYAQYTSSGPFPLQGISIAPLQTGYLKLDSLPSVPDAIYQVTCDIINPNYSSSNPVVIHVSPSATINGIQNNYGQFKLTQQINKFVQDGIQWDQRLERWDPLVFENYDNSTTLSVQNCEANYETSK